MMRLALVLILFAFPCLAGEWRGHPYVSDGDTIVLNGVRLQLLGIDAPESSQTCTNGAGVEYGCGEAATLCLQGTVRDQLVTCAGDRVDYWRRPLMVCWLGSLGLNAMVVRQGWAISAFGPTYIGEHNAAARDRVGLSSAQFQNPSDWRRARR